MKGWLASMTVLIAAAAAFVALLYVLRGLTALARTPRNALNADAVDATRDKLEDDRRRVLNHLREIQFDRDTGKLDEADFNRLRQRYEAEALAVLAALDAHKAAMGERIVKREAA